MTSFTQSGKKKKTDDEDSEIPFSRGWLGPEPSFEEKDKLFTEFKIDKRMNKLETEILREKKRRFLANQNQRTKRQS